MAGSLWGEEFELKKTDPKNIIKKATTPKSVTTVTKKSQAVSLEDRILSIKQNVEAILGRYDNDVCCIRTIEEFDDYISKSIENNVIAVDTETNNSLDPISCKLMGLCLFTPGLKSAYIPVNHVDRRTGIKLDGQITEDEIRDRLARVVSSGSKVVMHNAKFDYQVIKETCGIEIEPYWDTMVGTRILDENEKSAALKEQYRLKVDSTADKYDIEHLFEGLEYAIFDPELFALYAAVDAYKTYYLYEYQREQFNKPGHERLLKLFLDIEMKIVKVAADMELTGVCVDYDYASRLSEKYHKELEEVDEKAAEILDSYKSMITDWRNTPEANHKEKTMKKNKNGEYTFSKSKNEQLSDPPVLSSPTQLAILLYDIMKTPPVDKDSPRGTGEDILKQIDNPLCKIILEKRHIEKLIGTYIDKIPKCVNPKDNRLHAKFNQLGTDTGRFSSSDPNLQNIPSKNNAIRMMFKASEGCVLVGSDFSQQEPRLLSSMSNDQNMIEAYRQNKDLYATIAAKIYHNDYWDNMEHHQDGTSNPEGGKRRKAVKSLMLGIMYGMGPSSLAASIGSSVQEAKKIIDDFYAEFPNVKNWIDNTNTGAKKNGYVEDLWGRRRRLPDLHLSKYEVRLKNEDSASTHFNPLFGSLGKFNREESPLVVKYTSMLNNCKDYNEANKIKGLAKNDGVIIIDNGGKISRAERQCVNARIQGGAATMTKRAMIKVHNDEELNRLGFKMVLVVHDEIIGECPEENAQQVADRLCDIMKISALPECITPFKCDPTIEKVWYDHEYGASLKEVYEKLLKNGMSENDAFSKLCVDYCECTPERIQNFIYA